MPRTRPTADTDRQPGLSSKRPGQAEVVDRGPQESRLEAARQGAWHPARGPKAAAADRGARAGLWGLHPDCPPRAGLASLAASTHDPRGTERAVRRLRDPRRDGGDRLRRPQRGGADGRRPPGDVDRPARRQVAHGDVRAVNSRLSEMRRRLGPQRGLFERISEEVRRIEGLEPTASITSSASTLS